jgi:hypothetical protein
MAHIDEYVRVYDGDTSYIENTYRTIAVQKTSQIQEIVVCCACARQSIRVVCRRRACAHITLPTMFANTISHKLCPTVNIQLMLFTFIFSRRPGCRRRTHRPESIAQRAPAGGPTCPCLLAISRNAHRHGQVEDLRQLVEVRVNTHTYTHTTVSAEFR